MELYHALRGEYALVYVSPERLVGSFLDALAARHGGAGATTAHRDHRPPLAASPRARLNACAPLDTVTRAAWRSNSCVWPGGWEVWRCDRDGRGSAGGGGCVSSAVARCGGVC